MIVDEAEVTPYSPFSTILFRTKPICSTRMRRLVSALVFYIGGKEGEYCIRDHIQRLSGFPYGRTQHVRDMRSSIVSVSIF